MADVGDTTSTTAAVADVAVVPPIPGHESLHYSVPEALRGRLSRGMRVLVPLGKRRVTGIVLGLVERSDVDALRPILDCLDDIPFLSEELLALCRFAATYYLTSLGEVLQAAVVAGVRAESRRRLRLVTEGTANGGDRSPAERKVLALLAHGRPVRATTIVRAIRSGNPYATIRALVDRGLVISEDQAPRESARIRRERIYFAMVETAEGAAALLRARGRSELATKLRAAGERGATAAELGTSPGDPKLRSLVAGGLVRFEEREVYRSVIGPVMRSTRADVTPTAAQRDAIVAIGLAAGRFETFLLRGVTGSGKTEVYLRAAATAFARGRGVLILVPEIVLTHELVRQVCERFAGEVAVLHSGLSESERFDEWRRLSRGEARIAIGVRSAVFAPVRNLGLIVVDEEHDGAYKQEEAPRYNARDLAIVRARSAACPVVLGSATPSIESHQHAATRRYHLLELPKRVEERQLPLVDLVDLKLEKPEGEPPLLAPRLRSEMERTLADGGQVLLFLNRRGFAHYLQCTLCGHVIGCPNCSVTLTFHFRERGLRCHHCDHRRRAPDLCPSCGSPSLRDFGIGTEQVETAIRALFPTARVARMDRDTTARKGAQKRLVDEWKAGRIDILIGTQMITKGHDVPGVTLVGVLNADQILNFPDFRASERTFQLLAQVAGRSGRGEAPGKVLIQTYRPNHYALRFAVTHDFVGFAARELREREGLRYPPFSRLANVRLDGADPERVEQLAREVATALRAGAGRTAASARPVVLGPAPAPLERLRGRSRWQILVKARDPRSLRALVVSVLHGEESRQGVRLAVDVDPYSML